jgi:hypothetical protein
MSYLNLFRARSNLDELDIGPNQSLEELPPDKIKKGYRALSGSCGTKYPVIIVVSHHHKRR